jgi:hypothetical protein
MKAIPREETSGTPKGYYTVQEVATKLACTVSTVINNLETLPFGTYTREQFAPNSNRVKIHINQQGLDILMNSNYVVPEDYVSASELCRKLDIVSPSLYAFLYKFGYYDRALKIGSKKRRYYRVMFSPELADEIVQKYVEFCSNRKRAKKSSNMQPISEFLDLKFITPDLVQFFSDRTEVRYVNGIPHVSKSIKHKRILDNYMASLGFISAAEAALRLCVSRQRVHQIITSKEIRDDESICVRISSNRLSTYISEEFIDTFVDSRDTGPPEGFSTIASLAGRLNVRTSILRNLVSQDMQIQYFKIGAVKYYDEAAVIKIAEEYRSRDVTPKRTVMPRNIESTESPTEDWYPLTNAAAILRIKNEDLLKVLEMLNLNTQQYVRSRNGLLDGKHKLVNPIAVQMVADSGYAPAKRKYLN